MFAKQVERVVWQNKLAPETINVEATDSVKEIQVFRLDLKGGEVHENILRCIDQAISFPLIFELFFEDRIQPIAAHKRPSESDPSKWVVGTYYRKEWRPLTESRRPLPFARDLEVLYWHLFEPLFPFAARLREDLQSALQRMEEIKIKQREITRHEMRLYREKQFNLKVAIHAQLRTLKHELKELTR